jgi:hypothetical protein
MIVGGGGGLQVVLYIICYLYHSQLLFSNKFIFTKTLAPEVFRVPDDGRTTETCSMLTIRNSKTEAVFDGYNTLLVILLDAIVLQILEMLTVTHCHQDNIKTAF